LISSEENQISGATFVIDQSQIPFLVRFPMEKKIGWYA